MGGHHSTNTVVEKKASLDQHNLQDTSVHMDNSHGKNNIHGRNVGAGSTIYQNLQNLNLDSAKMQLQNLGANAVYIPETNSLVLLV